jgi:hypothetical protein
MTRAAKGYCWVCGRPATDSDATGKGICQYHLIRYAPPKARKERIMTDDGRTCTSRAAKRKRRVYCSQFASCRWAGYRVVVPGVPLDKCPRCGKAVVE